jgi:uncharacterized membrane protein (UPF0127 family)
VCSGSAPSGTPPNRFRGLEEIAGTDGDRVFVAGPVRSRLLGLAFLDDLPETCTLLIPRCSAVHTFGMRFPLDIAFLDRDGQALRTIEAVPPRRFVSCRGAAAVLERRAAVPGTRAHRREPAPADPASRARRPAGPA